MNKNIKIAKQLIKLAKQIISDKQDVMNQENIEKQLKTINIKEYKPFKKLHDGEWMCYPKNRNAELPDIYAKFEDGKVFVGYNYQSEDMEDYQGTPQQTISGMLQEIAIMKKSVDEAVVNVKNKVMDEKQQGEKEDNKEQDNKQEDLSGSTDDSPNDDSKIDDILK